jgi:hypothetical protein
MWKNGPKGYTGMWIKFANFLDILRVYRHAWNFGRHEEYTRLRIVSYPHISEHVKDVADANFCFEICVPHVIR